MDHEECKNCNGTGQDMMMANQKCPLCYGGILPAEGCPQCDEMVDCGLTFEETHSDYPQGDVPEPDIEQLLASTLMSADKLWWSRIRTFREAEVLSADDGLVITLPTGHEYQLTIVRLR